MPGGRALAALAGLCSCWAVAGSPVSLVQSAVRVHGASARRTARGDYVVDNSELKHKGLGVYYRNSKNMTDLAGKGLYAAWGTVLHGEQTSDGWFKYSIYWLPTTIKGAKVIKESVPPAALDQKKKVVTARNPKEAAELRAKGLKDRTLRAERKATRVAEAVTAKKVVRDHERALKAKNFVSFKVEAGRGTPQEWKVQKLEPMRQLMKRSCVHYNISVKDCMDKVDFLWKKRRIQGLDTAQGLGLTYGDTVLMHIKS